MPALMNAKDVIALAKSYIADVYGDEGIFNVGLEELEFDGDHGLWEVTLGFSRAWDRPPVGFVTGIEDRPGRVFKKLQIADFGGQVLGIKDRPLAA